MRLDSRNMATIGSFCSGIGGLDLAVESVFGGSLQWVAEIDKDASKVLAERFVVPNIGSVVMQSTETHLWSTSWDDVAPIDILTAGYPCQPFSLAGKRQGANDGRHLWPAIADAIRTLRPRIVCLENVRGHLSLGFDAVLSDLAALGFDAEWAIVPASAVGAPHRRERLYILATAHADSMASASRFPLGRQSEPMGRQGEVAGTVGLHCPLAADAMRSGSQGVFGSSGKTLVNDARPSPVDWGKYAPAIHRWERTIGRPAPEPLLNGRLNARLTEWMMGFPDGWCTDLVSNRDALRLCGNAVVPQAAAAAFGALAVRSESFHLTCL
jgi:DNA (cytosine-5)-methyltransferase 1